MATWREPAPECLLGDHGASFNSRLWNSVRLAHKVMKFTCKGGKQVTDVMNSSRTDRVATY
ncbi:hypothetical protein ABD76_04180 [Paenibacillus dendritiformis]|uniref:hypothetical protein n=1 Tax=Paenibacillus dendritiformis TaxID=130049 RepID=UPI0018CE66B5|nr:hypothetical protein [Paenibacillus dendritiformis]MBG9791739.1 hypothetical protein [Paenibacillus dendritiformis]